MRKEDYLGHPSQFSGVEEHRLVGGKGDGMRLLEIRNGLGMEVPLSLDRCADISRLYLDGKNLGYFSPCGYVHPTYYQEADSGFLKSFTAGFLTTCGLQNVGNPCLDEGKAAIFYPVENDGKAGLRAGSGAGKLHGRRQGCHAKRQLSEDLKAG